MPSKDARETAPLSPPAAPRPAKQLSNAMPEMALAAAPVDYENNVYFAFGSTVIDDRGHETLAKHAERLKEDDQLLVTLIAHTDHLGSRSYNQAIAEERLDAAIEVLRSLHVPRRQIRRIAMGNEKSNSNRCQTEACRQGMRRVELVYENSPRR